MVGFWNIQTHPREVVLTLLVWYLQLCPSTSGTCTWSPCLDLWGCPSPPWSGSPVGRTVWWSTCSHCPATSHCPHPPGRPPHPPHCSGSCTSWKGSPYKINWPSSYVLFLSNWRITIHTIQHSQNLRSVIHGVKIQFGLCMYVPGPWIMNV